MDRASSTIKRKTVTRGPATPVRGGNPPPTPTPVPVGTDTAAGKAIMGGLGQSGDLFRQLAGLFAPRGVQPGTPTGGMEAANMVPGVGTRGRTLSEIFNRGVVDPLSQAFSAGLPFGAQARGMNPADAARARYAAMLANAQMGFAAPGRVPRPR
jgi:hypothetical protein